MSEDFYLPRLLAQWNPTRGVWETGQMDLLSGLSELYSATWPSSGMTRNGVAYERPTPVLPTVGTASSSSPNLNTPTVEDAGRAGSQEWANRWAAGESVPTTQQRLRTQVLMLPTPMASDKGTAGDYRSPGYRPTLTQAIFANDPLLPTPNTSSGTGAGAHGTGGPNLQTVLLPTPVALEGTKGTTTQSSATKGLTGQVWLTNVAHDLALLNGESIAPPSNAGKRSQDDELPPPPEETEEMAVIAFPRSLLNG
jgi:hypothetical protein